MDRFAAPDRRNPAGCQRLPVGRGFPYSARRLVSGSTRVARRAGT